MSSLVALNVALDGTPAFDLAPGLGGPLPTYKNIAIVLEAIGDRIRYEEFTGRIVCSDLGPDGEWSDAHTTLFIELCEKHKLHVSPAAADRAIEKHARLHAYNVLTDFAVDAAAQWDGVARVDKAFTTYWRARNTPATRAAARVFFLSLLARALEPGAKVDTCPVIVGNQGARKSTAFEALVGEAWFSDSPLPIGDKDGMQNLRGTWLHEFAENASLSRKERDDVKAYLSTRKDRYRASYGRHVITVPRQTCFAASTNEAETLTDSTGERRYLPVTVGAVDVEGIRRDRIQLLGEAAHRVLAGEPHWPTDAETAALEPVRQANKVHDAWADAIGEWAAKQSKPFTMVELMAYSSGAFGTSGEASLDMRSQKRAAAILRALEYKSARAIAGRDRRVVWRRA